MDGKYQDMFCAPSPPSFFADDESRWQAVRTRDAVADGFFVYAVKTTKVYCRPICKARLARRANVRFYATGGEAAAAGFRACKRCRPELGGVMPEDRAVRQIRAFVRETGGGRGERLSLGQMAAQTGLSKWHFHRTFKRCVGVTPFEYLRTQRMAWGDGLGEGEGGMEWLLENELAGGFDFASLDGMAFGTGLSSEAASSAGEATALSLDDLLVWPEEDP
ncbi:Bifunctional transcriptional activator/DNA repair enzyme Ada [Tolypocladium ophioglossoides CBS 100239]|uniref:Bifunctional transcriptional activator/DNA repair enzyme Ada n=1 Tax=Tolypocladium ophioglossoides (strain CBS 100239) TaxID=1163406 RepID=A0A0L0NAR5_TOLOC|nr:Bifunctional transcriptional activator/DNA repair enzyme Ada [Tolypocladium ophioglossoides CBS 100239]